MSVENVNPASRDVLDCAGDLMQAFAQSELSVYRTNQPVTPESRRAALWLAVALGRCRLFGVALDAIDGVLPPRIALAAAEECSRQLRNRAEKAKTLAQELDEKTTHPANEEVRGDLDTALEIGNFIFVCMDLWAGLVAIDEAYHACVGTDDSATAALRQTITQTVADSQALDEVMQDNIDTFCIAAETSLLDNWRSLHVEPYRSMVAWGRDGTLETAKKCRILRALSANRRRRLVPASLVEGRTEQVSVDSSTLLGRADFPFERDPVRVSPLYPAFSEYAMAGATRAESEAQGANEIFPAIWDDVPLAVVWPHSVSTESIASSLSGLWLAYFNSRLFVILRAAPDHLKSATVELLTDAGERVECWRLSRKPDDAQNIWSFLGWLDGPERDWELFVFAVPIKQASELAKQQTTLHIAQMPATVVIPPVEQVLHDNSPVSALWSLLQDFYRRDRLPAACSELVELITSHYYRGQSTMSQTLAFYAFWLAVVRGPAGALLDDKNNQRMGECFSKSSSWPPAFARNLCEMLPRPPKRIE